MTTTSENSLRHTPQNIAPQLRIKRGRWEKRCTGVESHGFGKETHLGAGLRGECCEKDECGWQLSALSLWLTVSKSAVLKVESPQSMRLRPSFEEVWENCCLWSRCYCHVLCQTKSEKFSARVKIWTPWLFVLKLTSLAENQMWCMQNQGLGQGLIFLLTFKCKFSHLPFYLHDTLFIYSFAQIFFLLPRNARVPILLL